MVCGGGGGDLVRHLVATDPTPPLARGHPLGGREREGGGREKESRGREREAGSA